MKHFVKQILIFGFVAALVIEAYPIYLWITGDYKNKVAGKEIYVSIGKSKKKNPAKKIILGDSVARQLFDNTKNNDTLNSLACNQAIGLVGHYILLNNYLDVGNRPDRIFLIMSPLSFSNNLDQTFTYHYFVKPFYKEYYPLFTQEVKQQLDKIPHIQYHRFPNILTSNWAPNYGNDHFNDSVFISPISIDYLLKIDSLATKYNIRLTVLPVPTKKEYVDFINRLKIDELRKNNLDHLFSNYFDQILYLEDAHFKDQTHLKHPQDFTARYFKEFF